MSLPATVFPLLEVRGISKSFCGVPALREVSLEVQAGEVHALLGENGAGKSTLMHILAGILQPDGGALRFQGKPVSFRNPCEAQAAGISMVFQERSLAGALSVGENIYFGRQPAGWCGVIDQKAMRRRARRLLDEVGLQLDPEILVEDLSPAEQQMVEIAKALSINVRLLVLDEPTSTLTEAETVTLFRLLERLRDKEVAIIYISHRMAEIFRVCDRITVLRDGECQGTFARGALSEDELIRRMVGREFKVCHPERVPPAPDAIPALEVQGLSDAERLDNICFKAYSGQITALAGLAGSGRTELALAIFGARPTTSGQVLIRGRAMGIHSPRDAIRAGVGYLPEDRKEAGLFLEMSLPANFAVLALQRFGCWWLADRAMEAQAGAAASQLRLTNLRVRSVLELSGGNQQKIMLARWLQVRPAIFIVDEPTRGIDIGAKLEVHQLLRELARAGAAILLISSELPEVLALADRILVMREGGLAGEISPDQATEEAILRLAALPQTVQHHASA